MNIFTLRFPRAFFRKVVAAAVLIGIAAGASLLIRESIDSFDPENALPQITVNVGYNVPQVVRAGYEWSFFTNIRRSPTVSPPDLALAVVAVDGQVPVVIHFSSEPISLKVSRSQGLSGENYSELDGEIITPMQPGVYIYCIEAGFERGSIIYYFAIEIR